MKTRKNMKNCLILSAACLMLFSCNRGNDNACCVKQKCCPSPVRCCPNGQAQGYNNNDQDYNDGSHTNADWQITMNVKRAIMSDGNLSSVGRFISVSTTDRVVTLTGTVQNKEESRMIERAAKNTSGVRSVNNQLTISQ